MGPLPTGPGPVQFWYFPSPLSPPGAQARPCSRGGFPRSKWDTLEILPPQERCGNTGRLPKWLVRAASSRGMWGQSAQTWTSEAHAPSWILFPLSPNKHKYVIPIFACNNRYSKHKSPQHGLLSKFSPSPPTEPSRKSGYGSLHHSCSVVERLQLPPSSSHPPACQPLSIVSEIGLGLLGRLIPSTGCVKPETNPRAHRPVRLLRLRALDWQLLSSTQEVASSEFIWT